MKIRSTILSVVFIMAFSAAQNGIAKSNQFSILLGFKHFNQKTAKIVEGDYPTYISNMEYVLTYTHFIRPRWAIGMELSYSPPGNFENSAGEKPLALPVLATISYFWSSGKFAPFMKFGAGVLSGILSNSGEKEFYQETVFNSRKQESIPEHYKIRIGFSTEILSGVNWSVYRNFGLYAEAGICLEYLKDASFSKGQYSVQSFIGRAGFRYQF